MSARRCISRGRQAAIVAQFMLGGGAIALSLLIGLPGTSVALLGSVLVCGLAATVGSGNLRRSATEPTGRMAPWLPHLTWAFVLGSCAAAVWARDTFALWDAPVAAVAWLMAASFVIAHGATRGAPDGERLKGVAWMWATVGVFLWLGTAYLRNLAPAFYVGLLLVLGLGIALRLWVRPSVAGIQAANTMILLALALPVADWFAASSRSDAVAIIGDRPYSYATARRDPARFAAWWRHYQNAWDRMARDIVMPDPDGELPLRLRPGSRGYLMQSAVVINRHGFRGVEWDPAGPEVYRILALGESTTFGSTLQPEERPWPELFEELIRERLRPSRPVQVINAGVPAYTLADNLQRFPRDLLPLRADLIISYHGYNGFPMLRDTVPPVVGDRPPAYRRRPLLLLAQLEYRLRLIRHQHRPSPEPPEAHATSRPLLDTEYATRYRALIRQAEASGARLVLCTFAMAVDRQSPNDLVEFYQPAFPAVRWQIAANEAHSILLRELHRDEPQVLLVDIGRHLNGRHDHFIDLVHLTQEGRQLLAQTIFDSLHTVLRDALTDP